MLQTTSNELQSPKTQIVNSGQASMGELFDNLFGLIRRNFWIIAATNSSVLP